MSDEIFHTDSLGYVCGAFYTWTSHPPGFIGFNVLGRYLNYLFDDINQSFVVLSIAGSALSVSMVYLLGTDMFGRKTGLVASLFMLTSVNSYYFSEVALSYSLEGGLATSIAYLAWKAIKSRKWQWLLICTIVLSLGGSVRQTTLAFLFPLWIYTVWPQRIGLKQFLIQLSVLVIVTGAWLYPNSHFITKYWERGERGYLSSLYNLQIVMQQWYDTSKIVGKTKYTEKVEKFHWPFVEIMVASRNFFFPPDELAPIEIRRASNINAMKVILYQFCKLLLYLVFATGLATLPLLLIFWGRRYTKELGKHKALFLGLWILPAASFFIFGHFGSWGYLLLLLGGVLLIASNCLVEFVRQMLLNSAAEGKVLALSILIICGANLMGFLGLEPLPHSTDRNKLLNVAILQYTATGIRNSYAVARSSVFRPDYRQLPYDCVTDDCLVKSLPGQFGFDPATRLWRPEN
ncbi:MAG: glycosyltransferase family 39 protein [Arenicellales bacterium]